MGKKAVGRAFLEKHLRGGRLSFRQAVSAKCYECNAGYADGTHDCLIRACPLHPFMPYRDGRPVKARIPMSEEAKKRLKALTAKKTG